MILSRHIGFSERARILILAVLFTIPIIDSGKVPYVPAELWILMYAPAVTSCLWWAFTVKLKALQWMTVTVTVPGIARSLLYLIGPEHRLAPMAVNGGVAIFASLYHGCRRLDAI